jgi:hypothetical protein
VLLIACSTRDNSRAVPRDATKPFPFCTCRSWVAVLTWEDQASTSVNSAIRGRTNSTDTQAYLLPWPTISDLDILSARFSVPSPYPFCVHELDHPLNGLGVELVDFYDIDRCFLCTSKYLVKSSSTGAFRLGLYHPIAATSSTRCDTTHNRAFIGSQQMGVGTPINCCSGAEYPSALIIMANLASTHSKQGRWKEAEELRVKDSEFCKRVLGAEHPETLTSMATRRTWLPWTRADGCGLCS